MRSEKKLLFSQNSAAQRRRELIRRQRALSARRQPTKGREDPTASFRFSFTHFYISTKNSSIMRALGSRMRWWRRRDFSQWLILFSRPPSATGPVSQLRRNSFIVWGIRNHRTISTSQREKSHRRESQTFKPPDISATMWLASGVVDDEWANREILKNVDNFHIPISFRHKFTGLGELPAAGCAPHFSRLLIFCFFGWLTFRPSSLPPTPHRIHKKEEEEFL